MRTRRRDSTSGRARRPWLFVSPASEDAPTRWRRGCTRTRARCRVRAARQGAREIGRVTNFEERFPSVVELVKGDIAPWHPAPRHRHADLLHQRRQASRPPPGVLQRRHRVPTETGRRPVSRRPRPAARRDRPRDMPPAIRIEGLTKDFAGRVLAQAPSTRARRAHARHRSRRGLRVPGSERRRQDHDLEAADAAALSHVGPDVRFWGARQAIVQLRRRIGFLPEEPYFYEYLTAEELLAYFGSLFGLSGPERGARVARLLDDAGIGRGAAAPAAEAVERHDPAGRHRAGAHQRSGRRVPG